MEHVCVKAYYLMGAAGKREEFRGPEQVILKDKAGKIDATREWRPLWTVLKS